MLAAACFNSRLTISVLEPALVTLPASIQGVSIFPLPGTMSPSGQFDSLSHVRLGENVNIREIKLGYLHGMYDILSSSPRFKKVVISDTACVRYISQGYLYWDDVSRICAKDTTDVLLILQKAVSYDAVDNMNLYLNDDSDFTYYKIVNKTKWVFYMPETQTELAAFTNSDTVAAEGSFSPSELENVLYQLCYATGYNMGKSLCPHWNDDVVRKFYSGPGTDMKTAATMIMRDKWYDAALIWNRIAEGKNIMLASRAALNLALAFERDDDLDQAILWAAYADSLRSNSITTTYRKTLGERLKIKENLDGQLSGY